MVIGGEYEVKYIYAALLLHSSGKKIDEESIKKVIGSIGDAADEARVKVLIASLSDVNIDEAIKMSSGIAIAPAPEAVKAPAPEKKKEEEKKDEKKEDEAIAGLGALFG